MARSDGEQPVRLSVGATITLVVLVLGVGAAWARMEARTAAVESEVRRIGANVEKIAERVEAIGATVQDLSRWRDAQTGHSTTTKRPRP